MRIPIAKEALKFAVPLVFLGAVMWMIHPALSSLVFVALILVLLFFRDPMRNAAHDPSSIVSPADGKVIQIRQVQDGMDSWNLLSIFMSPLNVHINYAPVEGRVLEVTHRRGSFVRADRSDASACNESNTLVIQGQKIRVIMKQIAGILARRIVCYSREGDVLKSGQKIGLIQFGSRVDLYLPISIEMNVKIGDKVRGGASILAVLK
jgi:phosphatidylserine decarboxylase